MMSTRISALSILIRRAGGNSAARGILTVGAAVMLSLAGCQPQPSHPRTQVIQPPLATDATGVKPFTGNAIEAIDPCGDRMENLCGPLLLYVAVHHHGPAKVEELQAFADVDQTLKFTCPASGKTYRCAPNGLDAPGQNIRIYIYDAEPSHNGARWCAFSKAGASQGAQAFFADRIPESRFAQFLAAAHEAPPVQAIPK